MTKIDTVPGSMKETLEIQGRIQKKKKIKRNGEGRLGQASKVETSALGDAGETSSMC